jgi:hypothetical protein
MIWEFYQFWIKSVGARFTVTGRPTRIVCPGSSRERLGGFEDKSSHLVVALLIIIIITILFSIANYKPICSVRLTVCSE